MENRFGIKDFFILTVMCVLIVLTLLAMRQFDRQYDNVLTIKAQNEQLASDVARIKRQIGDLSTSGVSVAPNSGQSATSSTAGTGSSATTVKPKVDAFAHLLEAEQKPGFARGGWFLDNFGTKVGKLTPLISTDVYASWIQNLVMESLAIRDPYTLEFAPRLAKSWEISDDGLTMTFHLARMQPSPTVTRSLPRTSSSPSIGFATRK